MLGQLFEEIGTSRGCKVELCVEGVGGEKWS